ncbi:23S rRNA (uracil(1939)-C(5))-methyltransferase RlmD [Alkaliphilus peptidifermentans]|uniref:23S rRNA m(5)U-1939 methyltransferase n=1 Tax=Alkaliphilus peptidifermentans DSM 18978 TaxID=1120976 RepID=A0A1G5KZ30_9FIRM|nr:23S rRNA (uracil(1939)-C(5))-methyltransferase RlmD [Alkaliphilus peptidifermentans]SCZ05431.1 23S rRNA m(5)U-1939 methyltransferase [Alkaliphilus peptidifermentans DSM 18978]
MLEKNKMYQIEILDLGHNGEGIGKIDGFTIFVEGGLPGDVVKVKTTIVKKSYAIGKLIKIIKPSGNRIDAVCPIAHECGGCQIMNMDYKAQLDIKKKRVEETIKRIGKIEVPVHDTLGMDKPFEYRNKAQFPVGMLDGKAIMGFYQKGSHQIVDTAYCHIQHPINETVVKLMKEYIHKYNITVYDEKTRKGLIRHVVTKVGYQTGEVMVIIITNGRNLPQQQELVKLLMDNIKGLKSVVQNINDKNTNIIFGQETITLHGENTIEDYIGPLKFKISAQSFFQVNPQQTKVLYEKALEYADLKGEETVFDIYCGIGTISLFLAEKAKKVYGVEVVEAAIEDAKTNATLNNITNAEFYVGEAEKIVPKLYEKGIKADVVVVDPPRKGCEETVLDTIANMEPERIVYVSCNPATLARDLAYLSEKGYKAVEVQPVDMFPHTAHVECVALIERV